MYTPAAVRAVTDFSEFYEKAPHEMSRYELNELERIIRIEDGLENEEEEILEEFDENGEPISKIDIFKKSDEYFELRAQIKKIQPTRIGVFKRYWDKFKFNRKRRELLVAMFDETDV